MTFWFNSIHQSRIYASCWRARQPVHCMAMGELGETRRGILAANACFPKFKTQFSPGLHGLNCREYQIPHSHEVVSSSGACARRRIRWM